MLLSLYQTEKSYNLQKNFCFTLVSYQKINKIELAKILSKHGFQVLKVTSINPYLKTKRRGKGRLKLIKVPRPFKYYVKLAKDKPLTEEHLERINQALQASVN